MKPLAQAGSERSDYAPRLDPRIRDQKAQRFLPEKRARNCVMLARTKLTANPARFIHWLIVETAGSRLITLSKGTGPRLLSSRLKR